MRNIKLTLEYDGSRYHGWQRLGNDDSANTISVKLSDVIEKMTGEKPELICGSRTESGVHAYAQTVNFHTSTSLTIREIKHYLNRFLPMDIAVTDAEDMPERFHSSMTAASRTYLYRISVAEVPNVFERKYIYHSFRRPDTGKMKEAALLLKGKHDFQAFSSSKKKKSAPKEIFDIDIYEDASEIQISICATDFLHNMARIIVSTLLDIGLSVRPVNDVYEIFKGNVPASDPIDSKGLFLQEITYKKFE